MNHQYGSKIYPKNHSVRMVVKHLCGQVLLIDNLASVRILNLPTGNFNKSLSSHTVLDWWHRTNSENNTMLSKQIACNKKREMNQRRGGFPYHLATKHLTLLPDARLWQSYTSCVQDQRIILLKDTNNHFISHKQPA